MKIKKSSFFLLLGIFVAFVVGLILPSLLEEYYSFFDGASEVPLPQAVFRARGLRPKENEISIIDAIASRHSHYSPVKLIPVSRINKPFPHNGLFTRRNNAFGTKLTIGIKEFIDNGVMIEHKNIRFDDFVALNIEGIPSPSFNNALAVSYGIAVIPDYQKRDVRATHYLEIALRTANVASLKTHETKAPPVNYVFVVDTSGSMEGEKLDIVKTAIRELFDSLKADDVVGVIEFNDQPKRVLKATPVKRITGDKFGKIINRLTANGGTDIYLGLSFGINEISRHIDYHKVNQLFLFSDGNPTSGETNWIQIRQNIALKIREDAHDSIRLSTFGFGADASRKELDKLAGITGGQNTFVMEPEDVKHSLQQELDRRTHLAAINVQMQIEIDPDISILHLYGHDLINDPVRREAVLRELGETEEVIKQNYGVEPQTPIVTKEKGIRIFVPNLAVGETYWVVFEIAVPEQRNQSAVGKATVQYLDTFARQNEKYPFNLSPKGHIAPKWVAQHALGLWTSEVVFYALDDLYEKELDTAEKRIQTHISVLETAKNNVVSEQLADDVITLKNFRSLAQNLGKRKGVSDSPQTRSFLIHELNEFGRVRNGFIQKVNDGK
jgi:Mg-chelatase subunit ChlD